MDSDSHPASTILKNGAGPRSALGAELLPLLFRAARDADAHDARPCALTEAFRAWRELFGQAVGLDTRRLDVVVSDWSAAHGCAYGENVPAWLFAVHTYLAVVLRCAAAFALPPAAARMGDERVDLLRRFQTLERAEPFVASGILNLRATWFGWYLQPDLWPALAPGLGRLLVCIRQSGLASGSESEAGGDAFRALYEGMVPRELRHALGEVYTPDWLVGRALDSIAWRPGDSLLDPTCGMGGFLLEAVRRRVETSAARGEPVTATRVLEGLYGFDINPLAVLAARVSLVFRLARFFDPARPVVLPVYVADTIVEASPGSLDLFSASPADEDLVRVRNVPRVSHIAGNPPWVKFSQLPPAYAAFIKSRCAATNVFGKDRYVGGIEIDLAAVITHLAIQKWLQPGGRLAFILTGTLFSSEAGQGFRQLRTSDGASLAAFESVEDLRAANPFEGVKVLPALVRLTRGGPTAYPVPYRVWEAPGTVRGRRRALRFPQDFEPRDLLAKPVPGSDDGPWLKGTSEEHALWGTLFDASQPAHYRARKGVTTDCNGVYFVRVLGASGDLIEIENDPGLGRNVSIERVRAVIEREHVFPLMRGRGLSRLRAEPDPGLCILVPQRDMHGDPALPELAPRTWEFLRHFESALRERGSYRRYQRGKPFWSTWSTGPYTFSPWKVLWKEMSGARFCAAAAGSFTHPVLGARTIVPDHKLYFVPVETRDEADYLAGFLDAPIVARAVSAYAAQLSLGVSVVENLCVPPFLQGNPAHQRLSRVARDIAFRDGLASDAELHELDEQVKRIVGA